MNLVQTPMTRLADHVCGYYAAHPDLIVSLLSMMGADKVRIHKGQIRCTCPIHKGNNNEGFAVWFDKGFPVWRCHTDCNDKGTLCKLVMKMYGASFPEAVNWLAQKAGIQVSGEMLYVSTATLQEESLENFKRRLGLTAAAMEQPNYFPDTWCQWSTNNLYVPAAAEYLDYLVGPITETSRWGDRKRQFPHDLIAKFQIGYVPGKNWWWYDEKDKVNRGWYENRISFPWRSLDGRLIGFAGRRCDGQKDNKYKTLPGTKRAMALWGMHFPETREMILRTRRLNMVEGYTDVIRGHQHRCFNIIALGGTELTARQLSLVASFPLEEVVIYMDPDGPGMIAASKVAQQLRNTVRVALATPIGDEDPGELLSYDQFWTPIVQAKPFIPKE
jgi:DNA primase